MHALLYCYLTFFDHRTNISRKVCAPRRVSAREHQTSFKIVTWTKQTWTKHHSTDSTVTTPPCGQHSGVILLCFPNKPLLLYLKSNNQSKNCPFLIKIIQGHLKVYVENFFKPQYSFYRLCGVHENSTKFEIAPIMLMKPEEAV